MTVALVVVTVGVDATEVVAVIAIAIVDNAKSASL
jgi:hypothetical protein